MEVSALRQGVGKTTVTCHLSSSCQFCALALRDGPNYRTEFNVYKYITS